MHMSIHTLNPRDTFICTVISTRCPKCSVTSFNYFLASGGVERVERVVTRYNNWIENYGQEYKKTPKLTRAVERLRKYVSIGGPLLGGIKLEHQIGAELKVIF